jgi:hypothetical protein
MDIGPGLTNSAHFDEISKCTELLFVNSKK